MDYKLNLTPSPEDNRDFIFKSQDIYNTETFPEELDLRDELMPVRDQGSQGTCYAQSAACMKEWHEKHNYGFDEYFSPQFFYNLRPNNYDDNLNNDEGMFGRDVMRLLKNCGICSEKMYPYGLIEHKDEIPENIYTEAKFNVIEAYARVNTIDDLKMSLYLNGPALVGFPVYNYTGQMWKNRGNDSFKGGHAMTIVGYNDEGFLIRNSWGESWNETGYTTYYYEDWGAHWEIWSCVDKKDVVPPEPEPAPEPVSDSEDESEPEPAPEPLPENQESFCEKLFNKIFF